MLKRAKKTKEKKKISIGEALKNFPFYKSINMINFFRISGDFIIPDNVHTKKFEIFHPIALLKKFKYIKQIHVRKGGFIIEYDYIYPNSPSTEEFLSKRLDSLGNQFFADFSKSLKDFREYDLKQQKMKANAKQEDDSILRYFDEIFYNHRSEKIVIFGDEIISESDFSKKYYGLNNNMINYVSLDSDINYFDTEFIKTCENLTVYAGFEKYLTRMMVHFYYVMNKIKMEGEIIIPQLFETIGGLRQCNVRLEQFFFAKEKIMIYVAALENTKEELNFYNSIQNAKMMKNSQAKDGLHRKIERHYDLIRLYYTK